MHGIELVHDRYHDELAIALALYGYAIDQRPGLSRWDERVDVLDYQDYLPQED